MQPLNILLIEDDEDDILLAKTALKDCVHPLYIAKTGEEAFAMLDGPSNKQIDPLPRVVLIDINLPDMNGFEVLEELRKRKELDDALIFMLTGSSDEEDKNKALQQDIAGYIRKNLSLEKFINALGWHMSWGLEDAKRTPRVFE